MAERLPSVFALMDIILSQTKPRRGLFAPFPHVAHIPLQLIRNLKLSTSKAPFVSFSFRNTFPSFLSLHLSNLSTRKKYQNQSLLSLPFRICHHKTIVDKQSKLSLIFKEDFFPIASSHPSAPSKNSLLFSSLVSLGIKKATKTKSSLLPKPYLCKIFINISFHLRRHIVLSC